MSLAETFVSSSARKLPMRMRPDLTARQHRYQGETFWVVKEPVGLNYYRFQEEEYAILQMLNGETSLDEIKVRFERQFPPQKITVEELGQFLGMLHRSGLVLAEVPGQGLQLKKRGDKRRRQERFAALSNFLAIRFKGIDPERLLTWMHTKLAWIYSPLCVFLCVTLMLSALSLVMVQFDVFRSKLPTFHQFFMAENWIWLAATLCVTKIIHEFGHGLTCKHFGGECHEMGVMMLVLTPCLYCNVSDSWMLPNKWHRIAIGAGGMYIELVIASVCTFVWWFTNPGLVNQLCLSTMFVCSVSTVMFNANPLMRYDGYYILADWMEIPNLRQKSTDILSQKLGSWCLGLPEPDDSFLPQRSQLFFAGYSVASALYRWLVMISILFFVGNILEPYGLKIISQFFFVLSLFSLTAQPLWRLYKFISTPGRLDQVKKRRLQTTLGVLLLLFLAVVFIPLPYRVMSTLEIRPRDAEPVYVDVAGRLNEINVRAGDQVQPNQQLAQLENIDLQLVMKDLESKRDQLRSRLDSLRHSRFEDQTASQEIPQVQESLNAIEQQLQQKEQDLKRLRLVAPVAGSILPPPDTPSRPDANGQLPTWSGTPLKQKNLGAMLSESVLFCMIGDPHRMEAILVIDQDEIEFVRAGQSVDIKLNELPGKTFHCEISEVANLDLKITPKQLSQKSGGELITKTDEQGVERPMNTSYQARAPIDDPEGLLYIGLRGRAKVHTAWQTPAARIWRILARTFNFKF